MSESWPYAPIGITIGDPAGIGPEIVSKAVEILEKEESAPDIFPIGDSTDIMPGQLDEKSASRAFDALEESVALVKRGEISAIVNAPIHKANLRKIGFNFPGQTEFYAQRMGMNETDVTMMMVSESLLNVSLVSTHLPLQKAIQVLSVERITKTAKQAIQAMKEMDIETPRMAVCGLNPHAGEQGLFGDEEARIIIPAIGELQNVHGATVSGPYSPDTIFRKAVNGEFDIVHCMYHDQGLIPIKLLAFESGINMTLGLPFCRTSPDHGTALDIAGKGIASIQSLLASIRMAAKMVVKQNEID